VTVSSSKRRDVADVDRHQEVPDRSCPSDRDADAGPELQVVAVDRIGVEGEDLLQLDGGVVAPLRAQHLLLADQLCNRLDLPDPLKLLDPRRGRAVEVEGQVAVPVGVRGDLHRDLPVKDGDDVAAALVVVFEDFVDPHLGSAVAGHARSVQTVSGRLVVAVLRVADPRHVLGSEGLRRLGVPDPRLDHLDHVVVVAPRAVGEPAADEP
jgi:hypothetical protein